MFKYKANSNKKISDKKNPMVDSQYCYYQSFGRVIVGLEKALELHQGRIEYVTDEDILEYSGTDPEEYDRLFKSPERILRDVREEIYQMMSDAAIMPEGSSREDRLSFAFRFLQKNCPMVRVLQKVNDHHIWRMSLRKVVANTATDWPPVNTPAWEYLYANFCCQFALIMEKWETANFSDSRLKDCVRLADVWLSADGMLGDTSESLLDDWTES
ncbi:hypothetical protein IKG31_01935 [Candidatus Saccharibacteria bacterium]|nr:hypothetical protein [Candidatus Saccharibacteria bacterium]